MIELSDDEKKRYEENANQRAAKDQRRRRKKNRFSFELRDSEGRCPYCRRRFNLVGAEKNDHPGFCSKDCFLGKSCLGIRELERYLSPEEKKRRRQLRRQTRLKNENPSANDPDFYNSKAWQVTRFKVLRMYGFQCMACGRKPPEVVMHVDHIKPRSKAPQLQLSLDNLQVLCRDCNIGKSNNSEDDLRPKEDFLTDAARKGSM